MSTSASVREAGAGPPVVCLHCSASTGGQWRALTDRLAPRWRVLAPDLYGYGKDAPRDKLPAFTLGDEVDWLRPVLDRAGSGFTAESMPKVGAEFRAERRDGTSGVPLLDLYAAIEAPVLYLVDTRTRASAMRVGELLPRVFDAKVVQMEGAGHMGPVTHADPVNAQIQAFFEAHRA